MAWKSHAQLSFSDDFLMAHEALFELDALTNLIDWRRVEAHLANVYAKSVGNLAYPPLFMFKALLLQSWYALSDPALEKQLARDLLFRRFVGLGMADSVPDHSTIWRYRETLQKADLLDKLFNEINKQLNENGLIIHHGSVAIIDASVIEAHQSRPKKDKNGQNTQDPEAAWNVKTAANGKKTSTFGYKMGINADEDGFVKKVDFVPGNVHDSQNFKALLTEKEQAVYADSAYSSGAHSDFLAERGIKNCIIHRAYRNTPLTAAQKAQNRLWSGTRCAVERVFGILKWHYGMGKARYLGLKRNATRVVLMCIAYNLKRSTSILRASTP